MSEVDELMRDLYRDDIRMFASLWRELLAAGVSAFVLGIDLVVIWHWL